MASAEAQLPEAAPQTHRRHIPGPGPQSGGSIDTKRILRGAVRDEVKRTILREAEARYRHELMDAQERLLLLDRIKRLREIRGG